ncbi:MAG: tetratricopeptide repeat protein [Candidatus Omnitrophica bacterium]|nr:tetratricopeptide repeat protein [Candidatus Omnitrophota bacterium]
MSPIIPMADLTASSLYYRQGADLFHAGHYREALTTLKKVLLLDPSFPDAYFLVARIYTEWHRWPDALSMFEKVVALLPNDQEVRWAYGRALLLAGEGKKAVKVFHQALRMNPYNPRIRTELIRHYLRINQPRKALALAKAGIAAQPGHAPFYALAGDILLRKKKYLKAKAYYEECLEIDPGLEAGKRGFNRIMRILEGETTGFSGFSPDEEASLAMREAAERFAAGQYERTIDLLLDLKDNPMVAREASLMLGMAYARQGLYKRAHDVLLAFTRDHTPDILAWYNLGLACNRTGRYEEARQHLAQALAMDPEFEEGLVEIGYACLMAGYGAEALDYFTRALKIHRNQGQPYACLARMAFDQGDNAKAGALIKQAQAVEPECPEIAVYWGYQALVERRFQEAARHLQVCLDRMPDHFEALKLLGRAHLELHEITRGLACYRAAALLNPSDAECCQVLHELERGRDA